MKLKLTICMLLCAFGVWAQPSLFTTGVDLNPDGLYHHFIQTADGGFAQSPTVYDTTQQIPFVNLIRYDTAGRVLWSKHFPIADFSATNREAACIIQTGDAGFLIATTYTRWTPSIGAGRPYACLIKTDSTGNLLWSRLYTGYATSYAFGVCETADHGIAVCGDTKDTSAAGTTEAFLFKTDSTGNQLWAYAYNGSNFTLKFRNVRESVTHELIILGIAQKYGLYMRMDSAGTVLNSLYSTSVSLFIDEAETGSGNVVIMGAQTLQNYTELYEVTPAGAVAWKKQYLNGGMFEGTSMVGTPTGYTIASIPQPNGGAMRLSHVDFSGTPLWTRQYPDMNGAFFSPCLVNTSDNGYCIAGEKAALNPTSAQDGSVIVMKTDTMGITTCASSSLPHAYGSPGTPLSLPSVRTSVVNSAPQLMHLETDFPEDTVYCAPVSGIGDLSPASDLLSIFPNPAGDHVTICYLPPDDDDLRIRLCDAQGRTVFEDELRSGRLDIDLSAFNSGLYVVLLERDGSIAGQKRLIHR